MATILVVDDDADIRHAIVEFLGEVGHHVLDAGNGGAARKLVGAAEGAIHLVVTDIYMPDGDGIEVIDACRKSGVPVIAMSGGDVAGSRHILKPAKFLGAVEVLGKPFSRDELVTLVEAVLRRKQEGSGVRGPGSGA